MGTRHQRQPLLHRYLESTKDFEETHTEKLTKLKTLLMRRASAITEMADLPDVNDRTGGVLSMLGEVAGLLVKVDGWLDEVNTLWAELDRNLPYGP